ncbi:MAG: hypothetical protein QM695_07545 [Micropruina sp.]
METAIGLAIGVPLGVAQSILMLWIVFRLLGPRLTWSTPALTLVEGAPDSWRDQIAAVLSNNGRRDAVDVSIHAELRVSHAPGVDGVTRTVIRLPLNAPWMPRLRRAGDARVRIDGAHIVESDWARLQMRAGIESSTLIGVLTEFPEASVRLYALASDPFSGSRQAFVSRDFAAKDLVGGVSDEP